MCIKDDVSIKEFLEWYEEHGKPIWVVPIVDDDENITKSFKKVMKHKVSMDKLKES